MYFLGTVEKRGGLSIKGSGFARTHHIKGGCVIIEEPSSTILLVLPPPNMYTAQNELLHEKSATSSHEMQRHASACTAIITIAKMNVARFTPQNAW